MRRRFELKIPPLLLVFIAAALMWLSTTISSSVTAPAPFRKIAAIVLISAAAAIGLAAVSAFRKASTTVNPMSPETASRLVDSGVFRLSRNPMYLALLMVLGAWGIFLGNLWGLLLIAGFVFYMNQFQIKPEERALEAAFGPAYINYKSKVRRWL